MTMKAPTTTMPPTTPAVPAPTPLAWSWTYDGPIDKVDDPTCDMCIAVRAGKCLKNATQHGAAGCTLACSTGYAARVGYCHNHHGVANSLVQHPNEHVDMHRPTFDAASKAVLEMVASFPKDTKRVAARIEAAQNHEQTTQTARIEISYWR